MSRKVPRAVKMPWGNGQVVEEVSAHDDYKEAVIQLIEWDEGGVTLRFCQYWPDGRFQRQPLMLEAETLPAMRTALHANPRLLDLVRQLVEEP